MLQKSICGTATSDITYSAGSDLDKEHVVLVAQFGDFRPRKSIHVQRVVINVQPVGTNAHQNIDQFGVLQHILVLRRHLQIADSESWHSLFTMNFIRTISAKKLTSSAFTLCTKRHKSCSYYGTRISADFLPN